MNKKEERALMQLYGQIYGVEPKDVNGLLTVRSMFYRDRLRTIVRGLIKVECPDDWDVDYLKETLINYGYVMVSDSPVGVNPFFCSFTGYNYTMRPTGAIVSVPTILEFTKTFGEDAELVYFERRNGNKFTNYTQIINVYAEKLASVDGAIDSNLINTRFGSIVEAENKAQAETIKDAFARISLGEPLVVVKEGVLTTGAQGINAFFNNVSNTFIVDRLQDAKRSIMNEFLTTIGINNANTDKRERLNSDEVNANNEELHYNIEEFNSNLKRCCEKVNAMFTGINFSIELKEEVEEDAASGQHESVGDTSPK